MTAVSSRGPAPSRDVNFIENSHEEREPSSITQSSMPGGAGTPHDFFEMLWFLRNSRSSGKLFLLSVFSSQETHVQRRLVTASNARPGASSVPCLLPASSLLAPKWLQREQTSPGFDTDGPQAESKKSNSGKVTRAGKEILRASACFMSCSPFTRSSTP